MISMPSGEHDIQKLLPLAQQMSASLGNNISSLKTMIHKSNKGNNCRNCVCQNNEANEISIAIRPGGKPVCRLPGIMMTPLLFSDILYILVSRNYNIDFK